MAALLGTYAVLPLQGEWWWLGTSIGGVALAATFPLMAHRLRAVLVSDQPYLEASEALVLLLTTLVVGFAAVYFAMDANHDQFVGLETRVDAIYFTVTTLSTVGFGDILATGQVARIVVTAQIVADFVLVGFAVRVFFTAAARRAEHRSPGT